MFHFWIVLNRGILRAVKTIVSEEGVRALWKGTSPGLFRVIPGAGLNFLALHTITNLVQTANGSNVTNLLH